MDKKMKKDIDDTYIKIEDKILNHEIYQNVKDYSKAKEKIKTYLEIGELLSGIESKYGKSVIKEYSQKLTIKFGKKYSISLLYNKTILFNYSKSPDNVGKINLESLV